MLGVKYRRVNSSNKMISNLNSYFYLLYTHGPNPNCYIYIKYKIVKIVKILQVLDVVAVFYTARLATFESISLYLII